MPISSWIWKVSTNGESTSLSLLPHTSLGSYPNSTPQGQLCQGTPVQALPEEEGNEPLKPDFLHLLQESSDWQ